MLFFNYEAINIKKPKKNKNKIPQTKPNQKSLLNIYKKLKC